MFGYVHGGSTEQTTNRFKRSQNLKKDKKVEMAPRKQNQGHRRSNRRGGAGNGRSCSNCPTPSENFYTTLNQYPIIKECLNWPRNQNIPQKLMETCQELVPVIKEEVGRKYAAAHQKVEVRKAENN